MDTRRKSKALKNSRHSEFFFYRALSCHAWKIQPEDHVNCRWQCTLDRKESRIDVIRPQTGYSVNRVRTRQRKSAKIRQKGKANSRDLTALTLITSFHTPTMMTQLHTLMQDILLRYCDHSLSPLICQLSNMPFICPDESHVCFLFLT